MPKEKTSSRVISRLNWYPKQRAEPVYLSMKEKEEIVNLRERHPGWPLSKIQKYTGCRKLSQRQILSWKNQINKIPNENVLKINQWVQEKIDFIREENINITDEVLLHLGKKANKKLPVRFSWQAAGSKWLEEFKKNNNFTEDI